MNAVSTLPSVPVNATHSLSISDGFSIKVTPETARIIRSVENKSGAVRVSFIPASAKVGTSLKSLGLKGSAAKAVLRRAKREIGSAIIGAMATAVASGKLDWKSATLSKTGTLGVFFNEGDSADAAEMAKVEEENEALKAKLAKFAKVAEMLKASGVADAEIEALLAK